MIRGDVMPMMQVALSGLNQRFGPAGVAELASADVDLTAPFGALARTLLGDELPRGFDAFVDTMPLGLQRGISAIVQSAVERGLPVTFAWAPGYDWELAAWDVADTRETRGGVTVLVRSRYPGDAHPLGDRGAG